MHGVLLRTPSTLDDAWKRRVAASVLSSLTDARCQRYANFILFSVVDFILALVTLMLSGIAHWATSVFA